MEYVSLGHSGLKVSKLCLGCMTYGDPKWRSWVLAEVESNTIIEHALELGINFFDTADMYSLGESETIVGRALKQFARRDQVIVATKVYYPMGDGPNDKGLSRKHLMDSIDASLKRLGTDYVDLYQIHRWDPETPMDEVLSALDDIVRAGKVRYLGASAMPAWTFARALYRADQRGWTRFASMQNHYNLVYREEEREMIPLCRAEGVGMIPYSPLARGFLACNRKRNDDPTPRAKADVFAKEYYYQENDFAIVDRVVEIAKKRKVKPAQVALAWVARAPGVTAPIIGASQVGQLDDAVAALEIILDDNERATLEEHYRPRRPTD